MELVTVSSHDFLMLRGHDLCIVKPQRQVLALIMVWLFLFLRFIIIIFSIDVLNCLTSHPFFSGFLVFNSCHHHSNSEGPSMTRFSVFKFSSPLLDHLDNCWQDREIESLLQINGPMVLRFLELQNTRSYYHDIALHLSRSCSVTRRKTPSLL